MKLNYKYKMLSVVQHKITQYHCDSSAFKNVHQFSCQITSQEMVNTLEVIKILAKEPLKI